MSASGRLVYSWRFGRRALLRPSDLKHPSFWLAAVGLLVLPSIFALASRAVSTEILVPVAVLVTAAFYWCLGALREVEERAGVDEYGFYPESRLLESLRDEIARSRRYGHEFAVIMVSFSKERKRFDYSKDKWPEVVELATNILRTVRQRVDRVYHHGPDSFVLILPESGEDTVEGLVRRLRRSGQVAADEDQTPATLPLQFGATFYPSKATTAEALLRRASLAMNLARRAPNLVHIDGAQAPELPPPEAFRAVS